MSAQADPLAIYRIGKQGAQTPITPPEPPQESDEDTLSMYRIAPPEKSYGLKDFPRVQLGLGARSGEIVAGAPGDIQQSFGGLLDLIIGKPVEYFSGKKHPGLREFLRDPHSILGKHRETAEELERGSLSPGEASSFNRYPTSEEFRENITKPASEALTGEAEFLEPQNEPERFGQEFAQDVTRLALPGSGVRSWMSRIGLSLASNSAKELSKQLGHSPSTQELIKAGTMGIVALAQIGNAPQFARNLFQQTKAILPRGVRFNSRPLEAALARIRNTDWFRGHPTPSTTAARQLIESIEQRIQNGSINAHEAMTLRENINELASNYGAFNVEGPTRGAHVARLNEVRDSLIDGMEQTLGRQYPTWWQEYQSANAAYAITQRSTALGNFIASNYARPVFSETGKVLFGNALAKGAAGIAKLGVAAAGVASGARAVTIANRLRNPTLRRYYGEVVEAALQNNAVAMSNALEKFDSAAIKEEKKEKATKVLLRRQDQRRQQQASP